jgi:hypothetical protein
MGTFNLFRRTTPLELPPFDESTSRLNVSVPSIAKPNRAGTIVSLSIVSGVLSTFAAVEMNHGYVFYLGPGILFGLIVLLPWCWWCQIGGWQTLATVCLAPLGYAAAVQMVLSMVPFCLLAGLVGSAVTFTPILLAAHPNIRFYVIVAVGVGWIVGIAVPILFCIGGVLIWQVCVAYCLSQALAIDEA